MQTTRVFKNTSHFCVWIINRGLDGRNMWHACANKCSHGAGRGSKCTFNHSPKYPLQRERSDAAPCSASPDFRTSLTLPLHLRTPFTKPHVVSPTTAQYLSANLFPARLIGPAVSSKAQKVLSPVKHGAYKPITKYLLSAAWETRVLASSQFH